MLWFRKRWKAELPFHMMALPSVVFVLVFCYGPMAGVSIAFQQFVPTSGLFGSEWIGLDNFQYLFSMPDTKRVIFNTVYIAVMKMIAGLVMPIFIALLLNEIGKKAFKRTVQTVIYMPHFLSWVILGGIVIDVLSPNYGLVGDLMDWFGLPRVFFLGNENWFPYILVSTDVWKEFGFGTIVFLAALTGINPALYESAVIDGAGRWKQTLYVTLPGILPIVVLMGTLSLGNVLNAGFDQVFNLYNPTVYSTGDILDTYVYRMGFENLQFGVATAVGLFKSAVSFVLISVSYLLAYRFANYRIF
ncbi:ABC transporter permease [Cohnella lupini]|uniref:Putative aldouronate transport system permease protein n=1 Tax=Cohnella lupini TaxID=1294267 RepID=A0A3D9HSZ7_9BACL|nr:ABC transporter permease subunit [Cohnella lupini]RED52607.1 putative aldouronate transport system permease protein [Cohnella lupini]